MNSTARASSSPSPGEGLRFRVGAVRGFGLALLLVITWVTALVVYLPAGWVWAEVSPGIELPRQVEVDAVSGSVWSGAAMVRVMDKPVSFSWRLKPGSIIYGFIPLEWEATTARSHAEGSITATLEGHLRFLMREARVDLAEITALGGPLERVRVPGVMALETVLLVWGPETGLREVRGSGQWPGGTVTWPMGSTTRQSRMPALEGVLTRKQKDLVLAISDREEGITGVRAVIDHNGYANLEVFKHWVDLIGLDVAANADADEVVFNARRRVLP